MNKIFIICLSLILPTLLLAQQEIKFTVSINSGDTLNINETVDIKYSIQGTDYQDFQLPEFEGFRVVSGPFQSTSISYVNGVMSRETSYSYRLLAVEGGTFLFMPATIIVGDETLETEPLEITIVNDGSVKPRMEPKLFTPSEGPSKKKKDKTIYSI